MGNEMTVKNQSPHGDFTRNQIRKLTLVTRSFSTGSLIPGKKKSKSSRQTLTRTPSKEIVTVSKAGDEKSVDLTFPPPRGPLVPVGYQALPSGLLQVNAGNLLNFGQLIVSHLYARAEHVGKRQMILCGMIQDIESHSKLVAGVSMGEPLKKFHKIRQNFAKLDEIDDLISKIETEACICVSRLKLINSALPSRLQLEPLNFSTE